MYTQDDAAGRPRASHEHAAVRRLMYVMRGHLDYRPQPHRDAELLLNAIRPALPSRYAPVTLSFAEDVAEALHEGAPGAERKAETFTALAVAAGRIVPTVDWSQPDATRVALAAIARALLDSIEGAAQ